MSGSKEEGSVRQVNLKYQCMNAGERHSLLSIPPSMEAFQRSLEASVECEVIVGAQRHGLVEQI